MLIARGFPIGESIVVAVELLLLGGCAALCLATGLERRDWPPVLLLYGLVLISLFVSMRAGQPILETLRAISIISLFVMVGQRMTYETLDRLFCWLFAIVLAVLVLETASLSTYVAIFSPASFYEATRGIAVSEFNNSGLFNTATSYEGRFSFGLFAGPRASSIFLEQISNANFACIAALYLSVRGRDISRGRLWLGLATIALLLPATNSRFGSLLVLLMLIGYIVFPLLPRITLPLGSLAIFSTTVLIALRDINARGDDLQGRFAFVGQKFREADFDFYLGGSALRALGERDSGYTFVIGTTTIFGLLFLWLFVHLATRMDDAPSRRLAWGLVFYFFGQMIVSATSLLSMKTAALLWVMVGCVRVAGRRPEPERLSS